METRGKIPSTKVIAVVPGRLESQRLKGKLLLEIGGKPLVLHTLEKARQADLVNRVIAAVDSEQLFQAVTEGGFEAVMTSRDHLSGSDRVGEVAEGFEQGTLVVNLQADEPLIHPAVIDRAVELLALNDRFDVSTTSEPVKDPWEVLSPDVVKVVAGPEGTALYFSRAAIPYPRDEVKKYGSLENALEAEPLLLNGFRKHTGLYVFRRESLLKFCSLPRSLNEEREMLEQLRLLDNGFAIGVAEVEERSVGVDTEADLERVRAIYDAGRAAYAD